MPFQPFGYHFTVKSEFSPAQVRALIRLNKKKVLDPKVGTRGWVAGPFICLWLDPYSSTGPSLFGFICADGAGTRIHGRAGSNLFGIVFISLVLFLTVLALSMLLTDRASIAQFVGLLLVAPILVPLLYWQAHRKRREAEPLVRFLDAHV